jgi:hypothetical protein
MILLSLSVLLLGSGMYGQTQPGAATAAQTPVTEVIAMASAKPGVAVPDVMKLVPEEVREVAQLYMDGKIEQWYTRSDGKGQIFILRCKSVDEAKAVLQDLPLVKAGYAAVEYIPVSPYTSVRILTRPQVPADGGATR